MWGGQLVKILPGVVVGCAAELQAWEPPVEDIRPWILKSAE